MTKRWLLPIAGCLALAHTASAEISFQGFASVVGGFTFDEDPGETTEAAGDAGAVTVGFRNTEYEEELSFRPDTLFALQVSNEFDDKLSITAQIIAEGNSDFDAEFGWAYLSYNFGLNHTLRVGRMRIPFYKYSDFLDVGYAYPWIKPSQAMYSVPFSNYEGVSLLSNFRLGAIDIASNVVAGRINEDVGGPGQTLDADISDFVGLNVSATWEWFSAYLAYFEDTVEVDSESLSTLAAGLEAGGSATSEQTSQLLIDEDRGIFIGYGAAGEFGNALLEGEFSTTEVEDSATVVQDQWYISLSYRIGKFQPYVMYAESESERNTSTANVFIEPIAPIIQTVLDANLYEYSAYTLGLRSEVHPNAVVKVEINAFEDIIDHNPSSAFGSRVFAAEATSKETGSIREITFGIDVVF